MADEVRYIGSYYVILCAYLFVSFSATVLFIKYTHLQSRLTFSSFTMHHCISCRHTLEETVHEVSREAPVTVNSGLMESL